jgi:hypothetical protein
MALEVLLRQTNFQNNNDLAFQFRLARDLGMTVAQLTSTMSSKEFIQWANFYMWENNERNKALALQQAESRKR